MFAAEIRKRRVRHRSYSNWRRHLDEVFVRINGKMHYLWRAVDPGPRFRQGIGRSDGGDA
jgi:putative transposase